MNFDNLLLGFAFNNGFTKVEEIILFTFAKLFIKEISLFMKLMLFNKIILTIKEIHVRELRVTIGIKNIGSENTLIKYVISKFSKFITLQVRGLFKKYR